MSKRVTKILKVFTSVLVVIAVAFAVLLVGVRLFGLQIYTILSGSMEPEYPTGSLIYVKEMDPQQLAVDDVITYRLTGDTTATHRIVALVPDEEDPSVIRFRTKGDSNDFPDAALVAMDSVVGVPVFTIPYLGFVVHFIQQPPGMYIAIAVAAVLVFLVFFIDTLADGKQPSDPSAERKESRS